MMVLLRMMRTVLELKRASNPRSQNWLMERRALLERSGKRWACQAASGRVGKSSKAVWVDVMIHPLGSRTLMPEVVAFFPTHGLSVFKK
jgi:hypothetical protein